MHEVLVNPLGGLSLPRKSVVRLTDRPDMTLDVYRGRKTTIQHSYHCSNLKVCMYNRNTPESGHDGPYVTFYGGTQSRGIYELWTCFIFFSKFFPSKEVSRLMK